MESVNSHLKINWYRVPCDKDLLGVLHKKDNLKALSQCLCYLSLIICTGLLPLLSFNFLGNTVGFLAIFLHGTVCAFTINAVHELIHGTPFRDKYLNSFFCSIFAFVGWHNHYAFWASHTQHHKFTLHPPFDQEIILNPPKHFTIKDFLEKGFLSPLQFISNIKNQFSIATLKVFPGWQEKSFSETTPLNRNRAVKWSRFLLTGHLLITIFCVVTFQFELLFIISMTPMYGGWLFYLINNTQHAGLVDNSNDFRKSCRTISLNPFLSFLYWKMNYHIEHHMFPGVPFYNLPKLHIAIRRSLPHICNGIFETWTQIISIQNIQRTHPDFQFNQLNPWNFNK